MRFFLVLVILLNQLVFCAWAADPEDTHPMLKTEPQVSKEAWISNFKKVLPSHLCQSHLDFLKCYDYNEEECAFFIGMFADGCLENMSSKMPEKLSTKDAELYGELAGRCIHDLYQLFLAEKRIVKEGCEVMPKTSQPVQVDQPDPTQPGR